MDTGSITLAALEADPDPILAELRADAPVAFVDALDMWLVTRWDDVATMEADPQVFSAATEPSFLARALGQTMLTCDPPMHTEMRAKFQPPFLSSGRSGPFVIDELAPMADRVLDGLDTTGFDLMTAYAEPLAAGALATVLGLDHHGAERMWSWCEGLCADIANFENDPEITERTERTKADLGAAIQKRIDNSGAEDGSAIARFV